MSTKQNKALLHVPPSMTKFEVKEYLTKIYDINVVEVRTVNFLGINITLSSLTMWKLDYMDLICLLIRALEAVLG